MRKKFLDFVALLCLCFNVDWDKDFEDDEYCLEKKERATADDYIKKKMSDRLYKLHDGTEVQRDWYSSYLLYCYDYRTQNVDKEKCITEFKAQYNKEKALIAWIKANKIKILNSGIKVA